MVLGTTVLAWPNLLFNVFGMTFDGRHLYLADASNDVIHKYARDGTLIDSWPIPTNDVNGLIFDGRNFWYCDNTDNLFYCVKIDGFGIRVVSSMTRPNAASGLGFDGKHLWAGRGANGFQTFNINSGQLIRDLPVPGIGISDMAFDGKNFWVAGLTANLVYCVTPNGVVITSFARNNPRAITFDGKYIWVGITAGGFIECIEVN